MLLHCFGFLSKCSPWTLLPLSRADLDIDIAVCWDICSPNKVFQSLLNTPSQWFCCMSCTSRSALVYKTINYHCLTHTLVLRLLEFQNKHIFQKCVNSCLFLLFFKKNILWHWEAKWTRTSLHLLTVWSW